MPFNKIYSVYICSLILSVVFSFLPNLVFARTAPNIPLNSRIYNYLDILDARGFIKSGILSTRPFSRVEGRRLADEALKVWDSLPDNKKNEMQDIRLMLDKLDNEFSELKATDTSNIFFKPIDTAYLRYIYSDDHPDHFNTNNNGDDIKAGHNVRAGISSDLRLGENLSLYFNPEFRGWNGGGDGEVLTGYGLLNAANIELVIGREPLWWGPGYHGSFLLTNNARPFGMVRITSQSPFILPWIFRGLGELKPTLFVTQLEDDRDFSHAKLLGMRFDFRPFSSFRIALSRVIMFGGEGRKSLTISDWFNILIANDNTEHGWENRDIDNNQIISLDFSVMINSLERSWPFSGMKIYGEIGAEDSSGNGWPKEKAFLAGMFVDEPLFLDNTNLRIEWATTAVNTKHTAWYTHGQYNSGYTYEGRIIGHHIGADAEDIFARVEYFPDSSIRIGLETDFERRLVHADPADKRTWTSLDVMYQLNDKLSIIAGYGVEDVSDASHVAWIRMDQSF
ncbi:MAG TPA: capsule assembly Wzi family protein [Nitrospirota bacterium]|nr:capsule assembly Wzi family protein [Nitrospirota bacterium]